MITNGLQSAVGRRLTTEMRLREALTLRKKLRWRHELGDVLKAAAEGILTARYDWRDVNGHPCETALLQARILRKRGWTGKPRPCSPACPVERTYSRT